MLITKTAEYLICGAPGARSPEELMDGTCTRLREDGMPVARGEAFVRTLHPNVVGRSFVWHGPGTVTVHEHTYAFLRTNAFLSSPVAVCCRTNAIVRHRASEEVVGGLVPRGIIEDPRYADVTDYVAAPMRFLTGEVHAITLATRDPAGFTDVHLAQIAAIVHPMARIGEIHALARTAVNLLDTYVGRNAGEKILSGRIHLGDTESIQAVVWFSDLRGFTRLAASSAPADLIRTLNELFECQVPEIEAHGGDVLKFIGDGILALFPIRDGGPAEACRSALSAARDSAQRLAELNAARTEQGREPLAFGLALHVGEVAYGNIGGASRLDFTCIGPAVNLTARLEGLTGELGVPVVTSAAFAEAADVPMTRLGDFELKGVTDRQIVFRP